MTKFKTYIVTLLLITFQSIWAQKEHTNHVITHFGSRQGLSHGHVNSIVSDQQNIKWIGTENGITKYNGSEFDYIRLNKKYAELKNENIGVLFTDSKNNLWIGTKGGGFSMLNIEKNTIKNYNYLIDPHNKSDQRILSIAQDAQGNIWIGTWGNGIFVIDPENETLLNHFNTTCLVYTILKDIYGNMWWGNYNVLTRYNPVLKELKEFPLDTEITDLINDPFRNKIWIGTALNPSTNIYNFDHTTQKINPLKTGVQTSFARYLAMDQENKLWIGTWSNGLYVSDADLKTFTEVNIQKTNTRKDNINFETVLDIHIDKNNIIWLSMAYGGGVIQIIPNKKFTNAYHQIENGMLQRDFNVQSIYKGANKLWVGTFENGLFMGDNFSSLKNVELQHHKSASYTYKNKLFVGFLEGFRIYNIENQEEIFRYPTIERVNSFLIDQKERLWIGTEHDGIAMVPLKDISESKKYRYFHDGGSGNFRLNNTDRITDIKLDKQGNVWVGTHNGFHIFDENSQSFIHNTLLMDEDLPSTIVNNIHFTDTIAWVGTANGLLKLIFANNALILKKKYTTADGLNNDFISSITSDNDNNLWLSTTTEIVKFDVKKNMFINYGEVDGIETSSFNQKSVFNDGDYIYFGGIDNVTYFDPENITNISIKPEVVISKTVIDNQHITPGQLVNGRVVLDKNINSTYEIVLTHREKAILINFGLNDYLGELNAKYKYKLEGFQDTWIDLKNRNQISFTGLPSGTYNLHIIGSRDNQEWSEPKTISLVIKPSPFLSIWAYVFYVILCFGFLWLLYFIKTRQDKLKTTLEIARIDKEKETELTEAKLKFFTNISHEFRTPLTLIVSPLAEILENKNLPPSVIEKLIIVQRNSNRLLNLVSQLLDFRKADHNLLTLDVDTDNFVSFAHEVFLYFNELATSRNIQYTFQSTTDDITFPFDRNNMEIVLCNLLFNAFKNTSSKDEISLTITKDEDHCIITIKDSGKGIEEKDLERIFDRFYQIKASESAKIIGSGIGLAFSKKIIELHQGTISVNSIPNIGSEFMIILSLSALSATSKPNINTIQITSQQSIELNDANGYETIAPKEYVTKNTILVIDDNSDIRKYLRSLLIEKYNVDEAKNGGIGFKKAVETHPDLIICDIMMPVKDGLSVCNDLKKQIATSHIPIVLLTARSSVFFELEGLETGADDYITKPFNPAIVKAKIASILSNREKLRAYLQNKVRFAPKDEKKLQYSEEEKFIQVAVKLVETNLQNNEFGIEVLVDKLHMSQSSLYRKIKSLTGLSLTAFIRSVRLKAAGEMILNTDAKLSYVAYEVGFNDYNYFKKSFKQHFNCLPSEYKNQKKKEPHSKKISKN